MEGKVYKERGYIYMPYSFEKSNGGLFFDGRPSFSFGTKIVAWIGARRIGKTYLAKTYCTKRYLRKGALFAWIRDNDEARKKIANNNGAKFFSDYLHAKFGKEIEGKIDGETIEINGNTAGYLQPASLFQNYKGNDFQDIKTVVYDEFIPEHGRNQNSNRVWQFINAMYTILSTRKDAKMLLLANALDRGDEILDLFGFDILDYGIYVNREKDVCLHYCDNSPEFNTLREQSIMGRLIKGTQYEDNLFHNKFADDTAQFYDKRPSAAKLFVILHAEVGSVRVYLLDDKVYCGRDVNTETRENIRFVAKTERVNTRRQLIPPGMFDTLKRLFEARIIFFENAACKNIFLNFLKKA